MNRRLVFGGAAVLAVLVALTFLLPTLDVTDTRFSAYGDADDDASLLVNGLRQEGFEVASLTLGTPALDGVDPDRTDAVYVAIGPDRGYPGPEADAVVGFAERGGTVVVLDDTGASDELLDRIGVEKGASLLSTEGNPSVVDVALESTRVNLWEPVELQVDGDADATVLATTGNGTAKDVNKNGQIDPEDPTCDAGCALIVRAEVGEGAVYVVGDATFATNQYAQGSGAIPALTELAQRDAGNQRALVVADESRHVAGVSEVGLTVFRLLTTPLGVPLVAYTAAGLVVVGAFFSILRRDEVAWPEHDPRLDDPYLDAIEEEGST